MKQQVSGPFGPCIRICRKNATLPDKMMGPGDVWSQQWREFASEVFPLAVFRGMLRREQYTTFEDFLARQDYDYGFGTQGSSLEGETFHLERHKDCGIGKCCNFVRLQARVWLGARSLTLGMGLRCLRS